MGLATNSGMSNVNPETGFDTDSVLNSLNADFYEFSISNAPEVKDNEKNDSKKANAVESNSKVKSKNKRRVPELEPLD